VVVVVVVIVVVVVVVVVVVLLQSCGIHNRGFGCFLSFLLRFSGSGDKDHVLWSVLVFVFTVLVRYVLQQIPSCGSRNRKGQSGEIDLPPLIQIVVTENNALVDGFSEDPVHFVGVSSS